MIKHEFETIPNVGAYCIRCNKFIGELCLEAEKIEPLMIDLEELVGDFIIRVHPCEVTDDGFLIKQIIE